MDSLAQNQPDSLGNEPSTVESSLDSLETLSDSLDLSKLNQRQRAFVREYCVDLNGTRAAIRAGYNRSGASVVATRLVADSRIAAAIAHAMETRAARVNMTADSVLEEVATLANASVEHYKVDDDGNLVLAEGAPPNAMRAIQSVKRKKIVKEFPDGSITITYEVEFKLWDKPGALKLMGRHVGIKAFADRLELTGAGGGPIEVAAQRLSELSLDDLRKKTQQLTIDVDAEEVI